MTSASSLGLKAWLIQRLTAVYMALFIVFSMGKFLLLPPQDYQQWIAWVAHPGVNAALALFILSLLLHTWVGLRDVIMDYVKPVAVRAGLFSALIIVLSGCGLWSLRLLLQVAG
ncbi:MAG: succinate dehydrogenase [Gammaproteobacteria bacterium SG8_11]|nr:MAG: succinate dehydrogenase [Gammaproteobacteria bacterium SG8_11]